MVAPQCVCVCVKGAEKAHLVTVLMASQSHLYALTVLQQYKLLPGAGPPHNLCHFLTHPGAVESSFYRIDCKIARKTGRCDLLMFFSATGDVNDFLKITPRQTNGMQDLTERHLAACFDTSVGFPA